MALNAYLTQTSRLLHDPNNQNYSISDLTAYINIARGQISAISQSVRNLNIVNLVAGTETYPMPNPNANGIGAGLAIFGISCSWGTYKPTLDRYSWSEFQAYFRLFSGTVQGFPECWSQFGKGSASKVYFFPIPSQTFASEWDCSHQTTDLATDSDPEALSYPYTDCVPFHSAWLAYSNAQRFQEARAMLETYKMFAQTANAALGPVFTGTQYPGIPGENPGRP